MQTATSNRFRLLNISIAVAIALQSQYAFADDYEFDTSFFGSDNPVASHLSRFSQAGYVPPGVYEADIFVNGSLRGRSKIEYRETGTSSVLCISPELLTLFDFKPEAFAKDIESDCENAEQLIPQAKIRYDQGVLALKVEVPQALTVLRPRGYIPRTRWETGVPSAFVNYNISHYENRDHGKSNNSQYLYLNGGVNVGGLGIRHAGSMSRSNGHRSDYRSNYIYGKYGLGAIKSELTAGDFITEGTVVDSVPLRGAMLASDTRMLPQSQRGYAPRIQGVARGNATVIVRQAGNVIYQTNVPAGPFDIQDLYPTGYSGELFVEIREADGSSSTFTVPYSTLVPLMRDGQIKYQIAAGRYRNGSRPLHEAVMTGSLQYGIANNVTLSGGFILNNGYRSGTVGMAVNTPIGAFSSSLTRALTDLGHSFPEEQGLSINAEYNLRLDKSRTNITLAAYRHTTRGYYSFDEAIASRHQAENPFEFIWDIRISSLRPKNRYLLTVSQQLPENYGSFYFSGNTINYWNKPGTDVAFNLSYANNYKSINYQVGASQLLTSDKDSKNTRQFFASMSMPLTVLSREDNKRFGQYHMTAISSNNGPNGIRQSINGSAGEFSQLSYGLSNVLRSDEYKNLTASATYRTNKGTTSASYSIDNRSSSYYNLNASGAVVAHPKGITLSDSVGGTFGVVHAENGAGARLNNGLGKKLDYFGNAVIEHLTPYEYNRVGIDPRDLPMDIEFDATEREVVPKANTTALIKLSSTRNTMVLFNITHEGLLDLPMGAPATNEKGEVVGYVSQGGLLFANRLSDTKGTISIAYDRGEVCRFDYNIPDLFEKGEVQARHIDVSCPINVKKEDNTEAKSEENNHHVLEIKS